MLPYNFQIMEELSSAHNDMPSSFHVYFTHYHTNILLSNTKISNGQSQFYAL